MIYYLETQIKSRGLESLNITTKDFENVANRLKEDFKVYVDKLKLKD